MLVQDLSFEAIGTWWTIRATGIDLSKSEKAIHSLIDQFDHNYSRFRSDSLVSKMAEKPGKYLLPANAKPLLNVYHEAYALSNGRVTPLIGQTLVDAGYDSEYSLQPKKLTSPLAWEEVLEYSYPHLHMKQPALLDFGAAGKGYLVDLVGNMLRMAGAVSFYINAGGDVLAEGEEIAIGLEHPLDPSRAIGILHLKEGSICGSAGNRRSWGGYHHMIDPFLLKSPTTILAAWGVAKSALLADMLTTCLFFKAGKEFAKKYEAEYLILYDDFSIETSAAFPAELFIQPV